jgi:hypothetical protein
MIEDELEESLKTGCSNIGTIAKKAIDELRRLRAKTTGWDDWSGFKDGEGYINDLDEYFKN